MTNKMTARHYIQQAVLWITLASLIGVGSFTGLFRKFSGLPEGVVAEVNGYDITRDEYLARVQDEEKKISLLKQQYGAAIVDLIGGAEELALSTLTQERLLSSAADELGISIDDTFAAERVNNPLFVMQFLGDVVPPYVFDKNGKLDKQGLVKVLQRRGISVSQFEGMVEELLRRMLVGSIVSSATHISRAEVDEALLAEEGTRDLEIVHLPHSGTIAFLKESGFDTEDLEEKARESLMDTLRQLPALSPEERAQAIKKRGGRIENKKGIVGVQGLEKLGKEAERIKILTVPETVVRIMAEKDGYLVTLKAIQLPETSLEKRSQAEESLAQQRMQGLPYEFIATQQKRATIKVNPSMLANKRSRR